MPDREEVALVSGSERIVRKALVIEGGDGRWHVRLVGGNNEIVLSSELYEEFDWAERVAGDFGVPVEVRRWVSAPGE